MAGWMSKGGELKSWLETALLDSNIRNSLRTGVGRWDGRCFSSFTFPICGVTVGFCSENFQCILIGSILLLVLSDVRQSAPNFPNSYPISAPNVQLKGRMKMAEVHVFFDIIPALLPALLKFRGDLILVGPPTPPQTLTVGISTVGPPALRLLRGMTHRLLQISKSSAATKTKLF